MKKKKILVCNHSELVGQHLNQNSTDYDAIYSFSPKLLFDSSWRVKSLSQLVNRKQFTDFLKQQYYQQVKFDRILSKHELLQQFKVLIAKQLYMSSNIYFQALSLFALENIEKAEFTYLSHDTEDVFSSLIRNRGDWQSCLLKTQGNNSCSNKASYSYEYFRVNGWPSIATKLMDKIPESIKQLVSKATILVYGHNELLRDVCSALFKHRISMTTLRAKSPAPVEMTSELSLALEKFVQYAARRLYSNTISEDLLANLCVLINNQLQHQCQLQLAYETHWRKQLDYIEKGKHLVFANYPAKPDCIALANYCRTKAIKFIAFQHGVARELSDLHINGSVCYENNVADIVFTFNQQASVISNRIPFKKGKAITLGAPSMYYRVKKNRLRPWKKVRYLYVSTNVQLGDLGVPQGSWHDYDRALEEIKLIRRCFSKLQFDIWMKSYPLSRSRYLGSDVIFETASHYKNIKWIGENKDLRFLIKDYDLLITARATSTLAWCLMSDKPLVFINYSDDSSIKPELVDLFTESLFYFNAGDGTYQALIELLTRPYTELVNLWKSKKQVREQLIHQYICDQNRLRNFKSAIKELRACL